MGSVGKKHAYLLQIHQGFEQIKLLLTLLDDPRNDIYICCDKKAGKINVAEFVDVCQYSKVKFTDRLTVNWGGYSQVVEELTLLETAIAEDNYQYYHLLSGIDLPLHCQDYIHDFFDSHDGYEFLTFCSEEIRKHNNPNDRVKYYYPIQDLGFRNKYIFKAFRIFQGKFIIPVEKMLKVKRVPDDYLFGYGANWFSITDAFARYVVSKRKDIEATYKYGWCVDEVFMHTLLLHSDFKDKLFVKEGIINSPSDRQGNLRFINWWDPNSKGPHTWTIADKEVITDAINRGYLFARKFNSAKDNEIINYVVDSINAEKHGSYTVVDTL